MSPRARPDLAARYPLMALTELRRFGARQDRAYLYQVRRAD